MDISGYAAFFVDSEKTEPDTGESSPPASPSPLDSKVYNGLFDSINTTKITNEVMIGTTLLIGTLVVALNSLQIWFIRNKFRRYTNPLIIIFLHLSVADLLQGVASPLLAGVLISKRELAPNSSIMEKITSLIRTFGYRYVIGVSIVQLNALTVLKMMRVTRNKRYTKSTMTRICMIIWSVCLVIVVTEYIFHILIYPFDEKVRELWLSLFTLPTIILFVVCFSRMYCVTTSSERRVNSSNLFGGKFLVIASSQVAAFVICSAPLSFLRIVSFCRTVDPEVREVLDRSLGLLFLLNPVANSVVFLFVYRQKLNNDRHRQSVGGENNNNPGFWVRLIDILFNRRVVQDSRSKITEDCPMRTYTIPRKEEILEMKSLRSIDQYTKNTSDANKRGKERLI